MADVNVKEVDILKAYASKLGDFGDGCTVVGVLVDRQIKKIKDDLASKSNDVQNTRNLIKEYVDDVVRPYNDALSLCRNARPYIGESDLEAKSKLQKAEILEEQIKSQIIQLKTELENAGQHTKNFCLQLINMVEGCQSRMKRNIEALDNYVEQN